MKMLIILSAFMSMNSSLAFILLSENYRLQNPEETIVNVNADSCSSANMSGDDLLSYAKESIERFWNTVTHSKLQFKMGAIVSGSTALSNIADNSILIACANLGAAAASGATANDEGTGNRGVARIYFNDDIDWTASSREAITNVMIHEIGHAVGLHHSDDPASVMTYSDLANWSYRPKFLSKDDKNGVVYLYPKEKKLGILGSCGTISDIDQRPSGPINFLISFFFGLLFISFIKFTRDFVKIIRHFDIPNPKA